MEVGPRTRPPVCPYWTSGYLGIIGFEFGEAGAEGVSDPCKPLVYPTLFSSTRLIGIHWLAWYEMCTK
ncbi:hypothetical protein N7510_010735 [Penicillium lagena]|uniref:uncharacterized protein n=1 Tax=Penicillium lagena TaxID=94218 RepID=UPI0025425484|nr:uncharacterized protein N7510_010735 [Penicillium lagena]KAJ5601201.1 hypothetical protein N7510_010735 [Penicillium lagena]